MPPSQTKTPPWQPLLDFLEKKSGHFPISGLKGSAAAYLLAQIAPQISSPILILTPDEARAEQMVQELRFFAEPSQIILPYPSWDVKPFEKISPSPEVLGQRWETRYHLSVGTPRLWVVASLDAVLQKVPPREVSRRFALPIFPGQEFQREEFAARLEGMGYIRVNVVSQKGEFAVRGFVLDVFSPASVHPLRIEFFGDSIESVRTFDPDSQRSLQDQERATLLPVKEVLFLPEFREQAARSLEAAAGKDLETQGHAQEILEKMGISSRTQAIAEAVRRGWI